MSIDSPVVLDASLLFAAADADDPRHNEAAAILESRATENLTLPVPVVAEAAWLIGRRLGSAVEAAFLASVAAGDFDRRDLTDVDWDRVVQLANSHTDDNLGMVDASVVAVAERLGVTAVATFNRRDFPTLRPNHCEAFELLP